MLGIFTPLVRTNEAVLAVDVWCAVTATGVVELYFVENSTIVCRHFLHMMDNYTVDDCKRTSQ